MILCCGEALIDMIPAQTADGQTAFQPVCGGAVFNTAIALGRLGAQSGLFTGLSTDLFGDQLMAELARSSVDTSLIARMPELSTLAFVHLVNGHAKYTFFDENSALRMLAPAQIPADIRADALFFGGISLCSVPAGDTYLSLAQREAAHKTIMLDPNIRANFIQDEAAYRRRIETFLRLADIVKVSDEDLDWLFPDAGDTGAQIAQVLAFGPRIVLLTRGGDGATAFRASGATCDVSAPPVEVVDTVGAGDTFNAGFLMQLSKSGNLTKSALGRAPDQVITQALAMAAQVAAVTVSRRGADSPWAHELPNP